MTRGVDRGSRRAADDAAYPIDEIDAGWDDAPTSVIVPVRMSRQVSVTPTPSPWSLFAAAEAAEARATEDPTLVLHDEPTLVVHDEPTLVLHDDPTLVERDEPTLTLHDEPTLTLHDEPTPELGSDFVDEDSIVVLRETPADASALDIPNFRRRPRGSATRLVLAAALALAVAGAGRHFTRHVVPAVPAPLPVRAVPAAPPTVASPTPAPPPVLAAPEETSSSVTVVINVIPKRAVVFRGRERLGSGLIAVNVERDEKQRLTAVLPGYAKARFTVDGTRDTVTIHLSPVAKPAPAPSAPSEPAVVPSETAPPAPLPDAISDTTTAE